MEAININYFSIIKERCDKITSSKYMQSTSNDTISIVLLSIYNIKKLLHDHNLLISVNLTKIPKMYTTSLVKILHDNVCNKNVEDTLDKFIDQFDVKPDFLKKNSILIPYDVLINELCKQTSDYEWQQSIASLATTEYILSVLNEKLNKFVNEDCKNKIYLDESTTQVNELLNLLQYEYAYSTEIKNGIDSTIKSFLDMFDILCEVFYDSFEFNGESK